MATKPTVGLDSGYVQWEPAIPADSVEPTVADKTLGYQPMQYPPSQWFNWVWRQLSRWINYFAGTTEDAFIVSDNAYEQDYATANLVAAIAAVPAGSTLFIKEDCILAPGFPTLTIANKLKLKIAAGVVISTTNNGDMLQFTTDEIEIEGTLILQVDTAGVMSKCVAFNGDNTHCENIIINNISTGTITNAFYVEAAVNATLCEGAVSNTGGGVITNYVTDNSGLLNNLVQVREI